MPRLLKPITIRDRIAINTAIELLKNAREKLKGAGAKRAAAYAAKALKSAEGAQRHAARRPLKDA